MLHIILKMIAILSLVISLQAKDRGLSQTHLTSVFPEVSSQEISVDTNIEIRFDLPIVESSIKKNTIVIKNNGKKVKGITTLKDEYILVFVPNEDLLHGNIKVKVKQVRLYDFNNKHKYANKICSYFYDDIKECPLCKYLCRVKTKKIKYTFNVDDSTPKVISLKLNKTNIDLNILNTEDINVTATYDDNETKDLTSDIQWSMSDTSILSITDNIITPQKEGTTTLQATYNNVASTKINVTVYKEINGYKLPPEPDEALNNSTLLGIDVNANGVRDDVERKVIETYREPVKIEFMMIDLKIAQKILENPIGQALEYEREFSKNDDCRMHLRRQGINLDGHNDFLENNTYNTNIRVRAYLDYNLALSGGVYGSSPSDWNANSCEFDVDAMLGGTR